MSNPNLKQFYPIFDYAVSLTVRHDGQNRKLAKLFSSPRVFQAGEFMDFDEWYNCRIKVVSWDTDCLLFARIELDEIAYEGDEDDAKEKFANRFGGSNNLCSIWL